MEEAQKKSKSLVSLVAARAGKIYLQSKFAALRACYGQLFSHTSAAIEKSNFIGLRNRGIVRERQQCAGWEESPDFHRWLVKKRHFHNAVNHQAHSQ